MFTKLWRRLWPKPTGFCRDCGKIVIDGEHHCPDCWAASWGP